ncbi:hypothetical protein DPMN_108812 [Dreissena polymorpha]|uniref:Uncharacterized protein n=1 Tax=Dreissena polymorpha TaxID=45954 RepID=A0A9D4K9K2_DREPO|nr:hypothetical protein DPMN_108812 [Dreissena polymorpha]
MDLHLKGVRRMAMKARVNLEAIRPNTIISTRTTTIIGAWNVRTIYYSRNQMARIRRDRQHKLEYR